MINPQWLELPMSRTNFHGPKDIRTIEVRLYVAVWTIQQAHMYSIFFQIYYNFSMRYNVDCRHENMPI